MLKIRQARLQQYMNRELQDVQDGFKNSIGTSHQIANIRWVIEEAREFQKSVYFFIPKPLNVWITTNWKILKVLGIPDHLTCFLRNLFTCQEAKVRNKQTSSKSGKEYLKAVGCHSSYLTYMQSTSCEIPGWMHKLESRLLEEITIISDMQMTPHLGQKGKRN